MQAMSARQNDLDFQVAKLKAEAFDLHLRERDYEQLHSRFTALNARHATITEEEHRKQEDMRGQL